MSVLLISGTLLGILFLGVNRTDWEEQFQKEVFVNGERATLVRFSRKNKQNNQLYGEHISAVINENHILKGFVRLLSDKKNEPLPTQTEAQSISDKFLLQYAPDLLQNRKILWIEPHNESIIIEKNGKKEDIILTGMKVKSLNTKTNLYFWTIVNADKEVFIFERDIKWITFHGKRGTEKWLHDSWIEQEWAVLPYKK